MNNSKRIEWADIAKGIGILLVKIGHHENFVNKRIVYLIYAMHMPLFFFISGFFISNKQVDDSIKKTIKHKTKKILLPYFIYSLIYWCTIQIKQILTYNSDFYKYINWKGFIGIFIRIPNTEFISDHWFFWTLFLMEIIYIITLKLCKNNFKIVIPIIFVLSFIFFVFERYIGIKLINNLDVSVIALPFMMFGNILKRNYEILKKYLEKITNIVIIGIVFIAFCFINYKITNIHIDYNRREFGGYILTILVGLAGTLFAIGVSLKLKKSFILEYIGKNSGIYYLVSWIGEWAFVKAFEFCHIALWGGSLFAVQILGACLFPIPLVFIIRFIKNKRLIEKVKE